MLNSLNGASGCAAIECPDCGAHNRPEATCCRLCGMLLRVDRRAGRGTRRRVQQKVLRRTDFVAAAHANRVRTQQLVWLLLAISTLLGYLVGWNLQVLSAGAPQQPGDAIPLLSAWGMMGAAALFAGACAWSVVALRSGDSMVLRLMGARPVRDDEEAQLHNVMEEMALAAGLSKPGIYVLETEAMNAFTTGLTPRRAAICVTRGLLRHLTRDELQGVIGHEMGHIVNWDMRYSTAVASLVGLIALLSDAMLRSSRYGAGRSLQRFARSPVALIGFLLMLIVAWLAPLSAKLVQMAISRQREFLADATSVRLTRNPLGLVSALEKLARSTLVLKGANRATQHMFIVNPLRSFSEDASPLLATHPPVEHRIRRLLNLGAGSARR